MADIPYARWYSDGTVAYTKGSTAITGTNTFWLSAGIKAGDIFVDTNGKIYEITAVNDSTSITLGKSYAGDSGTGKGYSIIRNFNGTMSSALANQVSKLLNGFEQRYDLDMQTVTPKSAYDIAKDNGFTGTQPEWLTSISAYGEAVRNGYTGTAEEWLESLKAAGEWSALDERTLFLTQDTIGRRNSLYRGKYLGNAVTDEQYAAIQNATWEDIYLGDYWYINGHYYFVAEFVSDTRTSENLFAADGKRGIIIVTGNLGNYPMNDTDDMTGGFRNTTMCNETIPMLVETIIDPEFRELAKDHCEWVDTGCSPSYTQFSYWPYKWVKATLLRFEMVYGYLYPYYDTNALQDHKYRLAMFNHYLPHQIVPHTGGDFTKLDGGLGNTGKPAGIGGWYATRLSADRWLQCEWRFANSTSGRGGLPTESHAVRLWFYA